MEPTYDEMQTSGARLVEKNCQPCFGSMNGRKCVKVAIVLAILMAALGAGIVAATLNVNAGTLSVGVRFAIGSAGGALLGLTIAYIWNRCCNKQRLLSASDEINFQSFMNEDLNEEVSAVEYRVVKLDRDFYSTKQATLSPNSTNDELLYNSEDSVNSESSQNNTDEVVAGNGSKVVNDCPAHLWVD